MDKSQCRTRDELLGAYDELAAKMRANIEYWYDNQLGAEGMSTCIIFTSSRVPGPVSMQLSVDAAAKLDELPAAAKPPKCSLCAEPAVERVDPIIKHKDMRLGFARTCAAHTGAFDADELSILKQPIISKISPQ